MESNQPNTASELLLYNYPDSGVLLCAVEPLDDKPHVTKVAPLLCHGPAIFDRGLHPSPPACPEGEGSSTLTSLLSIHQACVLYLAIMQPTRCLLKRSVWKGNVVSPIPPFLTMRTHLQFSLVCRSRPSSPLPSDFRADFTLQLGPHIVP
jgi:hypothetical protein